MLKKDKIQLKKYTKLSLIGFIAGLVSGFFSTGGGLILVPAFLYLLEMDSQKARGTSVFCILPMVLTSSIFYYKGNFINWKVAISVWNWRSHWRIYWSKIIKKITRKIFENSIYNIFNLRINKNDNKIR